LDEEINKHLGFLPAMNKELAKKLLPYTNFDVDDNSATKNGDTVSAGK
jgi:hypothetical protein